MSFNVVVTDSFKKHAKAIAKNTLLLNLILKILSFLLKKILFRVHP